MKIKSKSCLFVIVLTLVACNKTPQSANMDVSEKIQDISNKTEDLTNNNKIENNSASQQQIEIKDLKINQDNQQIKMTDEQSNTNNEIILFMKDHEQSGVTESTKSDAQYYRVLIKKINESESLIQDFYISGSKLTDPYIATDNDNKYVYNENAGYDFYPRKGSRVVWYESGNKQANTYYENNKETSTWIEWYENGQKKSEITYINGKESSVSQSWNKSGILKTECSYKMGITDGRCYARYNDHPEIFIYDGRYKNGKKTGVWKEWDIDGFLTDVSFYGHLSLSKIKDDLPDGIFAYHNFDVNGDSIKDLIVTHKSDEYNVYQGDGLYVLLGQKNNSYVLDLEFTNFAVDGGLSHSAIMPRANNKGFIILGYDHGKYDFYIKNVHGKWMLEKYVHDGGINLGETHFHCVMNIDKTITDKYDIELPSIYNDSDKLIMCPMQDTEYNVTSERAEILDKSFEPRNPPNYFVKDDKVTAIYQNEDWIKVYYKNDIKTGWLKRDDLIKISVHTNSENTLTPNGFQNISIGDSISDIENKLGTRLDLVGISEICDSIRIDDNNLQLVFADDKLLFLTAFDYTTEKGFKVGDTVVSLKNKYPNVVYHFDEYPSAGEEGTMYQSKYFTTEPNKEGNFYTFKISYNDENIIEFIVVENIASQDKNICEI